MSSPPCRCDRSTAPNMSRPLLPAARVRHALRMLDEHGLLLLGGSRRGSDAVSPPRRSGSGRLVRAESRLRSGRTTSSRTTGPARRDRAARPGTGRGRSPTVLRGWADTRPFTGVSSIWPATRASFAVTPMRPTSTSEPSGAPASIPSASRRTRRPRASFAAGRGSRTAAICASSRDQAARGPTLAASASGASGRSRGV